MIFHKILQYSIKVLLIILSMGKADLRAKGSNDRKYTHEHSEEETWSKSRRSGDQLTRTRKMNTVCLTLPIVASFYVKTCLFSYENNKGAD